MNLLSFVLGRLAKRPVWDAGARRADPRYNVRIPVYIGPLASPQVAGTLINISLSGTAILLHASAAGAPAWLNCLNQSDELWLAGLFDVPTCCWVVVLDDDVLRVHFSGSGELRREIDKVVRRLTAG